MQNYYELTSVDEAISNYVTSHLTLTNEGLWVTKENESYKIMLSGIGLSIYDTEDTDVATFGE